MGGEVAELKLVLCAYNHHQFYTITVSRMCSVQKQLAWSDEVSESVFSVHTNAEHLVKPCDTNKFQFQPCSRGNMHAAWNRGILTAAVSCASKEPAEAFTCSLLIRSQSEHNRAAGWIKFVKKCQTLCHFFIITLLGLTQDLAGLLITHAATIFLGFTIVSFYTLATEPHFYPTHLFTTIPVPSHSIISVAWTSTCITLTELHFSGAAKGRSRIEHQ